MKKNLFTKKLIIFAYISLFFLLPNIVFANEGEKEFKGVWREQKIHYHSEIRSSQTTGGCTGAEVEQTGPLASLEEICGKKPTGLGKRYLCCKEEGRIERTHSVIKPTLQIDLPTLNLEPIVCKNESDCSVPWIANYISFIYNYFLSVGGILAAIILMAGGVLWLVSGGDTGKVSKAKDLIFSSISGLIILFSSYIILDTINPELTKLKPISLKMTEVEILGNEDVLENNNFNASDWKWNPGIEKQLNDASQELLSLLSCMRSKLEPGVGRISSISDGNVIGQLQECNIKDCNRTKCQHSCQSCHYGGGLASNKSYAVDFGNDGQDSKKALMEAARACNAKFILDEGNHVHVSVNPCPKN